MKLIHFSLITLSLFASSAHAFDAKQCQRIDDVSVPYDVKIDNASVTFTSGSDRIVVRPAQIDAGGRTFNGPQVGPYYGKVRSFLDQARVMANAALPFSGSQSSMSAAATQMCMAIVDVAASGAAVEQAFAGFVSPVRVKFK